MHDFDAWLIARLTIAGALIYGAVDPDVPAALRLYQESEHLPVTGLADEATVHLLRQRRSSNPNSSLIIFNPVPASAGSRYIPQELAA